VTTTSEALTGPWAANVRGWLVTVIPASLVVVVQEVVTPLPDAGWIALSVGLQLVAVTGWAALVAIIARGLTGRVPPVALGMMWLGIGVLRGVIGALLATEAGVPPEWGYRIGFWVIVTLCWMPLLTYALAQWDEHRRLLAERTTMAAALDDAASHAAEGDEARALRLAAAVDDALGPGLDEIRAALRASGAGLDARSAGEVAARLDALVAQSAAYTTPDPVSPPTRSAGRVSVAVASREFELRRPVFAALLTAADTAPLLLPEAFRDDGWLAVAEMATAIAVATALLMATYAILRPLRFTGVQRSIGSRVGVVAAGLAGAGTLLIHDWQEFQPHDLLLIAVFPLVFVAAASTTATAVALEATNVDLRRQAADEHEALTNLGARVRAADADAAVRLETLVRGELNGRLAGCAMALGFLAHGDVAGEARGDLVANVLAQLDAAAEELHRA
jgi:hypothetical protein